LGQVFTIDLQAPTAKPLFDEQADVTWPRVSPDGKQLAYVSYRDDAAGRLCVRALPRLERRCLDESGVLEAVWVEAGELLAVDRGAVEGDLRLLRVRTGGGSLVATSLGEHNLIGPAVSPPVAGRRWLAYVPLERVGDAMGD